MLCLIIYLYIFYIMFKRERDFYLRYQYTCTYMHINYHQSKAAVVFSFISLILFILEQTILYCRPLLLCLFTRVRSLNHPLPRPSISPIYSPSLTSMLMRSLACYGLKLIKQTRERLLKSIELQIKTNCSGYCDRQLFFFSSPLYTPYCYLYVH